MQTEPAEQRRKSGRGRRGEGGQSRAEPRGGQHGARGSEEEIAKLKEVVATMQQKEEQAGERGGGADQEEEPGRGGARDRSRGDGGGRRRERASSAGGVGGEQAGGLRWRVHRLEKEKLELTSSHNQQLCRLQAELARLRASVERGEAQRVELQYQLTVSSRDAARVSELSRERQTLTERAAELQQTVSELQRALDITRQARQEDQHALQQEVQERDRLIQSFGSENQRLHRLLQDQEEALQESERRMKEVQTEREKEAEVNRQQASEVRNLKERGESSRREKEVWDQTVRSLQVSLEAERAAHLESKFNSELIQLRARDLEAALALERSGQQEAQCSLELLRAQFREVERAYGAERERSGGTERALQRLQVEYEQHKSELSVALETERKMTSDLRTRLEEEKTRHAHTHTLLEQAAQTQEVFTSCMKLIRETLQQHDTTDIGPPAKDDGNESLSADVLQLLKTTLSDCKHRQEVTDRQVQDLLAASERLQVENVTLGQLTSDQSRQVEESQQVVVRLQQEVTRLRQESSDWSTLSRRLQAELERERGEREREREREREELEREKEELEREREEWERERGEWTAEVKKINDKHQKESEARLSFLHCVYQRLLAGCVLLHQPQSILGNFTWQELCDVINEQVDQLTSDLRKADNKIAHLQSVYEKKSVCVRELQRSQECVLSRLEESVRRREEVWSSQHTHIVTQLQNELQVCRSQCDTFRDRASSLQLRGSSLTSDLCRLRGLLAQSRRESACFLSACALLAGVLKHTHRRLQTLCGQKALLSGRLAEREALEQEVRRLAGALGGAEEEEEEEEEEEGRRRAVRRRWRRSVCVVLAVRRWRSLAQHTSVLFRVEVGGGGPAVCVCRDVRTGNDGDDGDEGRGGACARWLRSKRLSSVVLSTMADLQGALTHTGSAPPDVMSVCRSASSRLLGHLLNQSEAESRPVQETLSGRLRLGLSRATPRRPDAKALVSSLQQHFLLFSQRLHSAEVERRSLRLEVSNLRRGLQQEREDTCRTVPVQRFHRVCVELRQALSREQEAQALVQEQTGQLHTLQLRVNTHTAEQSSTQHTLSQSAQFLSEARQDVNRKERSLRILGKHLSGVQKEKKQLEERLQRVEDELTDATRRKDCLISNMKAAETSYREIRESLVQSRRSLSAPPCPLPLPREHLGLSGAESIMGVPEMAACRDLLSTFSQLYQTCSSRIDWLEQEVSAHRSHVTALRSELQDVCLRENLAYFPVAEFPETFPVADMEADHPVPTSDLSKQPSVSLSTAPCQINPASPQVDHAPSSPLSKASKPKRKEKKVVKKNRGARRQSDKQTDRK